MFAHDKLGLRRLVPLSEESVINGDRAQEITVVHSQPFAVGVATCASGATRCASIPWAEGWPGTDAGSARASSIADSESSSVWCAAASAAAPEKGLSLQRAQRRVYGCPTCHTECSIVLQFMGPGRPRLPNESPGAQSCLCVGLCRTILLRRVQFPEWPRTRALNFDHEF